MKKRGLGVLRCCAVSAILFTLIWGIIQPVSAGPVERPEQGRIVVDVPDVTQYYHQDAKKEWSDNNQSTVVDYAPDIEQENGSQNTVAAVPAYIANDQSDDIIVLDYGPDDGVILYGSLTWYNFSDGGGGDGVRYPHDLRLQHPEIEIETLLLEIDFNQMSMSGTMKISGVDDGSSHSNLSEGEHYYAAGTAVISFQDVSLVWEDEYERWRLEGGSGEAQIALEGSYYRISLVSGGTDLSDEGSTSGSVPLRNISGILDDKLILEIDHHCPAVEESLGAILEIHTPQINLSNPQGEQPQQEEQPQLEEAPDLSDSLNAPFSISAGCDASLASGQDIDCSLNIQRNSEDIGPLTVVWIMDGYVASEEQVLGDYSSFHFPNPPPGTHTVQVQVVDNTTGNVRVAAMDVEVGGFASPDEAPDRIPAGAQTASAMGTTALIGAWLWAEWMAAKANSLTDERRDAKEAKERQAWYENQMARNDEVRARQQARQREEEANQNALEGEWKRYRGGLLETVKKHEKSKHLVDLLDDLQEVVYRDGKWDADGLQRLERMINSRLVLDREDEARAEWERVWDFNKRQEAEVNSILRSHKMSALEVGADLLTLGASNLIFMPTKAFISAIYARRRAMMLGKTGTDAAGSVIKEAGLSLLLDYISGKGPRPATPKVIGKATIKYLEKRINVRAERGIAALQDDPEMPVHLWQGTGEKLGVVPKLAAKLPVVKSSWGNGAQTNLASPVYRPPGNNALMRVGMENGLDRISQIDTGLADNVRRILDEGAQVDPHINNVLSPGNPSYTLTPQDEIARNLINNASYKEAVQDGLVPNRVQQAVYQTRDKVARNAAAEAFRALDNIDLNGQSASSYLKNVTVTGTGARPLNPQAVGGYADWDATVIAQDSNLVGSAGRQAEELFKAHFDDALRQAGVNADTAEVSMFSGVHASPDVPVSVGYNSEGLAHWHKMDMACEGQSAVRLEDGGVMFNAHPDAAPMQETLMKEFGQMEAAPRFQTVSGDVTADARRLVHCHVNAQISETGGPIDPLAVLRQEGKHAPRVWKASNAGSGADMPGWMDDVMRLKNDPNYYLSGDKLEEVWKNYTEYMGLPPNLGGEG
ncbi:MAG: hypothetical protein K8R77_04320 [Anaerolineaceae bacterium]|nr:hypothetical protein [Anaerolineaceae bacterium]